MFGRLFTSKTFWTGLVAIATGAGLCATGNVPAGLNAIATGVLAIFIRDGIASAAQNGGPK